MAPTRRRALVLFLTAALVLAADLLTKYLVVSQLRQRPPISLIPGVLSLTYTTNSGGAFGLSGGTPWFFATASILVAGFIVARASKVESTWRAVALGLILGGAAGNLANRLSGGLSMSGRVVDFIDLHVWPVFNLADSAIVVGAAMVALSYAKKGEASERQA